MLGLIKVPRCTKTAWALASMNRQARFPVNIELWQNWEKVAEIILDASERGICKKKKWWWNEFHVVIYFRNLWANLTFVFYSWWRARLDVQLIPKFRGAMTDMPMVEWIKNIKLVCGPCAMDKVVYILSLWLWGSALAVYQLTQKRWNMHLTSSWYNNFSWMKPWTGF